MDISQPADLTLICGDSGVIKCHINILQENSGFFRELKIQPGGNLCLPDICVSDLLLVLEYIYTQDVVINLTDLPQVAAILSFLQIPAFIENVSIHSLYQP